MKKIIFVLFNVLLMITVSACGGKSEANINVTETTIQATVSYRADNPENVLSLMISNGELAVQRLTDMSEDMFGKIGESYDTYCENKEVLEAFYAQSLKDAEQLYAFYKKTGIDYFKCVAEQGLDDYGDWDDAMEDFYDEWDDGMEDYYDTWNDIFEEIYEKCDELIETAPYKEYSDAWSEMYENYSDTWAKMYETYLDSWNEIYDIYLAVWNGFYDGNADVEGILKDNEDKNKAHENSMQDVGPTTETIEQFTTEYAVEATETEFEVNETDIRPEFKDAMESYEAFYDEYYSFMDEYRQDPTNVQLLTTYSEMLIKAEEMNHSFSAWNESDLSKEELQYYIEVNNRVLQKLIEVTG